jgi:hypothetical protein
VARVVTEARLRSVLDNLRRGKIVQNRQLRTLLGEDGYARFLDDWQDQQAVRQTLAVKPDEIIKYEKLLKTATFAYSKGDAKSGKGRHGTAKKMFRTSDMQFERLIEYLSYHIAGRADLESWLDKNVHYDEHNPPSLCPEGFPRVVTSRSLNNQGGGLLNEKQTKRQVKIDAVERALEEMERGAVDEVEVEVEVEKRLAAAVRLKKLNAD